jgi:hypothetical protein
MSAEHLLSAPGRRLQFGADLAGAPAVVGARPCVSAGQGLGVVREQRARTLIHVHDGVCVCCGSHPNSSTAATTQVD